MHITDYEKVKDLLWNNLFLLDGGDELGTKTIFAKDLAKALYGLLPADDMINGLNIMGASGTNKLDPTDKILVGTEEGNKSLELNPGIYTLLDGMNPSVTFRRMIYRGKNLGTFVSDEQFGRIRDGSFKGFFIGDYWEIGGFRWRIVDLDYWWFTGDTRCLTHHLTIMPDQNLISGQMYATDNTQYGYFGTLFHAGAGKMNELILIPILNPIFGESHILRRRGIFSNAVTNGVVTGQTWNDAILINPSSKMIIGDDVGKYSVVNTSENLQQLAIYAFLGNGYRTGYNFWLQDILSQSTFAYMYSDGNLVYKEASFNGYVRPVFGLTG